MPDVIERPGFVGEVVYAPTPHIHRVPRRAIIKAGNRDPVARKAIIQACKEDPLFYMNVFGWIFEPRAKRGEPKVLPFITYPFQDRAILEILAAIGHHDLVTHKSRDMGASWMHVFCIEWLWHFFRHETFLFISEKESLVDEKGNPKSLFWKFDFIHDPAQVPIPRWLVPNIERRDLHAKNLDTHSVVDGDSTTSTSGTGDRRQAVLFDEFSKVADGYAMVTSSQAVSECRLFNFTPNGTGNAAYDLAHNPDYRLLRLHWSLHPTKAEGLYYDAEHKPRSPWYDRECRRFLHPKQRAQELDIDYLGSDFTFFEDAGLDRLVHDYVQDPWNCVEIVSDTQGKFVECILNPAGRLKLWMNLDVGRKPPAGREYVVACDISFGTGGKNSSNSSIVIGDKLTLEKVGEMVANDVKPDKWADLASAVSWWLAFNGTPARVCWEANGPGRLFGDRMLELRHPNLWCRTDGGQAHEAGWMSDPGGKLKLSLLGELNKAYREGQFINRSADSVRECRQFIFSKNKVRHSREDTDIDPSATGDNHGDVVIADGLCWMLLRGTEEIEDKPVKAPEGSLKWHEEQEEAKRGDVDSWIGSTEWEAVAA
jgi:hypothetical protein